MAAAQRQLAAAARAADKAEAARALEAALWAISNLHRAQFPPARQPIAPAPPGVEVAAIRAKHRKLAKSTTRLFSAERKAALVEAERRATVEIDAAAAHYERARAAWQATLDHRWAALNANDPATVLAALAAAFEDNEATAAAVGVEGAEVTLLVVAPPASVLPERRPTTTAAGNLSLKKLTKTETAALYKTLVCGHALATLKEAFAVAPALMAARVVAIRSPAAVGHATPEVLMAARFERSRLTAVAWSRLDALQIVHQASTELILREKGVTKELTRIELSGESELAGLLKAIDFEDLV